MQTSFDANNIEQNHAFDMIAKTNNSFFLTGRAGTGKTTFLKMAQERLTRSSLFWLPRGLPPLTLVVKPFTPSLDLISECLGLATSAP